MRGSEGKECCEVMSSWWAQSSCGYLWEDSTPRSSRSASQRGLREGSHSWGAMGSWGMLVDQGVVFSPGCGPWPAVMPRHTKLTGPMGCENRWRGRDGGSTLIREAWGREAEWSEGGRRRDLGADVIKTRCICVWNCQRVVFFNFQLKIKNT